MRRLLGLAIVFALLATGCTATSQARLAAILTDVKSAGEWHSIEATTATPSDGVSIPADTPTSVEIPSLSKVPDSARSLFVRVTVSNAKAAGTLQLAASGASAEEPINGTHLANVAFGANQTVSTTALLRLAPDRTAVITASTSVVLRIEITGYLSEPINDEPVGAGGVAVTPAATLIDSTSGIGAMPSPSKDALVSPLGLGAVPSSNVRAVWLQVTAATDTGHGWIGVSGAKQVSPISTLPSTSLVVAALNSRGQVSLSTTAAPSHLSVQVVGWIAETESLQAATSMVGGIVPVVPYAVDLTSAKGAVAQDSYTAEFRTRSVPKGATRVIVSATVVTADAGGDLRFAESNTALANDDSRVGELLAHETASVVTIVPVDDLGKAVVSTPTGAEITSLTVMGYVAFDAAADNGAPLVAITSPRNNAVIDLAAQPVFPLSGTATDTGSGIKLLAVSVDGTPISTTNVVLSGADGAWSLDVSYPAGTHTFEVTATDWGGNTSTTTTQIETVAPASAAAVTNPNLVVVGSGAGPRVGSVSGSTVTFIGIADLYVGQYLAAGSIPAAPDGLLRLITAVQVVDGNTRVETTQAALTDVIYQAHVELIGTPLTGPVATAAAAHIGPRLSAAATTSANATDDMCALSPQNAEGVGGGAGVKLSDHLGVSGTWRLEMTSTFEFTNDFELDVTVNWDEPFNPKGEIRKLKEVFHGAVTTASKLKMSISAKVSADHTFLDNKKFVDIPLARVPFFVGPVPVVIVFGINGAMYGEYSGGYQLSTEMTSRDKLDVGVQLVKGNIEPVLKQDFKVLNFGIDVASKNAFRAGLKIKIYAKFYGIGGPYVSAQIGGYIQTLHKASPAGRVESEFGIDWRISVGIDIEIFGATLIDLYIDLLNGKWPWLIWDNGVGDPDGESDFSVTCPNSDNPDTDSDPDPDDGGGSTGNHSDGDNGGDGSGGDDGDPDTGPSFSDDDFKQCILDYLPFHDPTMAITVEELESLRYVNCQGDLGDISALKYATNVIGVFLRDESGTLADISSVAALPHLSQFLLDGSAVHDVSALSDLHEINWIVLSGNPLLNDISPLAGLTNIEYAILNSNPISNISAVSHWTKLETLYLDGTAVTSLNKLSGLRNLTYLDAESSNLTSVAPLSGLTQLTYLNVSGNKLTSISPLATLTNLTELHLSDNRISSISPLATLDSVTYMTAENNRIADASVVSDMDALSYTYLNDQVVQLSPTTVGTANLLPSITGCDGTPVPSANLTIGSGAAGSLSGTTVTWTGTGTGRVLWNHPVIVGPSPYANCEFQGTFEQTAS